MEPDGTTRMVRSQRDPVNGTRLHSYELATVKLNDDQLRALAGVISGRRLSRLHKEYHNRHTRDGRQWILFLEQADWQKAVYFNNFFPSSIQRFASEMDVALATAVKDARWRTLHPEEAQSQQEQLWNLLKEKTTTR
jgi:hypothetical protein